MIRVGVNGYGVIGRRITDAILLQDDMELIGVTKTKPDYKAKLLREKGVVIYGSDAESVKKMTSAGLNPQGTAKDLASKVDIMVDATPEEVGASYKPVYDAAGCKGVFQGGEEHGVAGFSFVSQCNFDQALGRRYVRVVSCNTTALCRVLHSIDTEFKIGKARVVIARRAADPDEPRRGPIDSVVLDPVEIPSHHGPDVETVLTGMKVISMAYKVPTTHMHLHSLILSTNEQPSQEKILSRLESTTRILLFNSKEGFTSTAHVIDYARELGRNRGDLYEAAVWRDSVKVDDHEVYLYMGVHQESIVVPENVDAIRALYGGYSAEESMAKTNRSLKILR